ncbi:unnamed protein product [marine sediment metagenome]|uniref:PIN domain-containing protein n=1 Tax=marine sediment metagenome TaxID=412755 RepID=X1KF38_9ZZZZ
MVLGLAEELGAPFYDASYFLHARELGRSLISEDRGLVEKGRYMGVETSTLSEMM